jgi:hypothetical protein
MAKKVEKGRKKIEKKQNPCQCKKVNERIRKMLLEKQKLAIGSMMIIALMTTIMLCNINL